MISGGRGLGSAENFTLLNQIADNLGIGVNTDGPIDVIKLLCIDTIGDNDGDNGQDAISIFGDGDVTFIKDLFQYELRSLI